MIGTLLTIYLATMIIMKFTVNKALIIKVQAKIIELVHMITEGAFLFLLTSIFVSLKSITQIFQ